MRTILLLTLTLFSLAGYGQANKRAKAMAAAQAAMPTIQVTATGDTLMRVLYEDNYERRLSDYISQSQAFRYRKPTRDDTLSVPRFAGDIGVNYVARPDTSATLPALLRQLRRLDRRIQQLEKKP